MLWITVPTGMFCELEVGDGLARHGRNRVLAGDGGDLLDDAVEGLGIVLAVAAADGYDDLVDPGDLHHGLVLELPLTAAT